MFCSNLVLALLYSAMVLACSINSGMQYPDGVTYAYDCKNTNDYRKLIMCLLQRNTLKGVMQCTEYGPNNVYSWKVPPGSTADALDVIAPYDRDDIADKVQYIGHDSDGYLQVTPRGLIYFASTLGSCQECELTRALATCPYEDHQKFMKCLCCLRVTREMITCLENCIYHRDFGYYAEPNVLRGTRMDWECGSTYYYKMRKVVDKVADQVKISEDHDLSRVTDYDDCDIYKVENGYTTCYSEDDYDGSDIDVLTINQATATWSRMSSYMSSAPTGSASNVYRNSTATGTQYGDGLAQIYTPSATASSGYGSQGNAKAIRPGVSTVLAWVIAGTLLLST